MTINLNTDSFDELIDGDIDWLNKQPTTLEKAHIQACLEHLRGNPPPVKVFKMDLEEHIPCNKNNPCSECILQSGPMCLDRSYCEFPKTGKTWKKRLIEDK